MAIRLRVQGHNATHLNVGNQNPVRFKMESGAAILPPAYTGEYEVTPKVTAQSLATRNLMMLDDVSVLAIPYFENPNQSGTTVYIANEV